MTVGSEFDEESYLAKYIDVRQAVDAGKFPSGYAHYIAFGKAEGRDNPLTKRLRLHVRQEADVLTQVSNLPELLAPWTDGELGRSLVIKQPSLVEARDLRERVKGEPGGDPIPAWAHGTLGRVDGGLAINRVRKAIQVPMYGAVVASDGSVLFQSVDEALYFTPTLTALPGVMMRHGQPVMEVPSDTVSFERGTIFCTAGALNYGHFVLDCLSALLAVEERGLTEDYPILMPSSLKKWQRDLLDHMNPAGPRVEVSEPLIQVDDLLYASPMAHYLWKVGDLLGNLKARLVEKSASGWRRVYFSRSGVTTREMVNESALEAALVQRGFEIIKPETLFVDQQIKLMSETTILTGAVGAAWANCLFLPHGSCLIEIQPSNYSQNFVRSMCDVLGMEWYPFFCQSPLAESKVIVEGEERHGTFSFQLPLDEFLAYTDEILQRKSGVLVN